MNTFQVYIVAKRLIEATKTNQQLVPEILKRLEEAVNAVKFDVVEESIGVLPEQVVQ